MAGSSLTGGTALCPCARQLRKTQHDWKIVEFGVINRNKQNCQVIPAIHSFNHLTALTLNIHVYTKINNQQNPSSPAKVSSYLPFDCSNIRQSQPLVGQDEQNHEPIQTHIPTRVSSTARN